MTGTKPRELARVRRAVLDWYAGGHRALPWRGTRDPYAVLVSEVMLQQTQASRVALRYPRFMARFPDVAALASAFESEVLAEWSGLGYNRRALALRRAAVAVAHAGWPSDLSGLRELPGVGAYTARAIGSLAFGWPVGPVDTNVRRWLVRRFGLEPGSRSPSGGSLQPLADALALAGNPPSRQEAARWTHASIELGALVCRARLPACEACPVADGCPARDRAARVPVTAQGPFAGSRRAYRGALLRALAAAPEHAIRHADAPALMARFGAAGALHGAFDPELAGLAIDALEREGLAHRDAAALRLGPAPATDRSKTTATIAG